MIKALKRFFKKPNRNIAIVFIQWNSPNPKDFANSSLGLCLRQAAAWNPRTPILLIADRNPGAGELCEFIPFDRYSDISTAFEGIYQHTGNNDPRYNKFCIERWFIIESIMHEKRLSHCIHLDSDVMVYADLEFELGNRCGNLIGACGLNFRKIPQLHHLERLSFFSLHTALIPLAALGQFRAFVEMTFQDNYLLERHMKAISALSNASVVSGVNDMSLWTDFFHQNPKWGPVDFCRSREDGVADFNSNVSLGYQMNGDFRRYHLKMGQPYAFPLDTYSEQKHLTIHFQGKAKNRIPIYQTKPHN
jgi:hypothetical protein